MNLDRDAQQTISFGLCMFLILLGMGSCGALLNITGGPIHKASELGNAVHAGHRP